MRNLITGGAGFLGSHLVDRLMQNGEEVICLDNYFTGRKSNISKWIGHPNFELIRHDVTEPIKLEVDPASGPSSSGLKRDSQGNDAEAKKARVDA